MRALGLRALGIFGEDSRAFRGFPVVLRVGIDVGEEEQRQPCGTLSLSLSLSWFGARSPRTQISSLVLKT